MNHKFYYTSFLSLGITFLYLLFCSCNFSKKTCLKYLNKSKNESFDMVIVPGVPLLNGKWDYTMKGRILWSKYLYDAGIAKNIMYSGSAVYSPYYEGEVMALYAEALGIPKEHIYTETKAEHSTENIYYSYKKAKQLNFDKIALASDPFQTKLLSRFVRKKVSADIRLLPMVVDSLKEMNTVKIDPQINYQKAFVTDFKSLPERQGFWKRLRGTRGLNIDVNAYSTK